MTVVDSLSPSLYKSLSINTNRGVRRFRLEIVNELKRLNESKRVEKQVKDYKEVYLKLFELLFQVESDINAQFTSIKEALKQARPTIQSQLDELSKQTDLMRNSLIHLRRMQGYVERYQSVLEVKQDSRFSKDIKMLKALRSMIHKFPMNLELKLSEDEEESLPVRSVLTLKDKLTLLANLKDFVIALRAAARN